MNILKDEFLNKAICKFVAKITKSILKSNFEILNFWKPG
jgi:hypothetical protein